MDDENLFHLALEKSPDDRSAFLDRACAGDVARRRRLEVLLRSHEAPDSFLEGPAAGWGAMADPDPGLTAVVVPGGPAEEITTRSSPAEGPGSHVGPYKLLHQLGEGGMGTVYMAEQARPVRRKVALKVIKPGMDSRQVIARFEAERQALALMDHVNIARVLDAGATDSGRPFFVMELVHGVPITRYCDDNHLTPRERLELFVPVCQAIQHAHQKGIIHRDIKPSNVLVTLYDGKPVPKVIDFGVAKATEQKLTEQTLFTQYGTIVGTLEYMSPEQAEMSALGVDTRSDVYSLGVLLYELLTGSTPLSHQRMKQAAFGEILRMIKEEEPPKPSTRLSDSGEALASISAQRHTEPAKLAKLVRGELDWIVMKALEKDRNRRYETADGFAEDVRCHLDDETVQACPPSVSYRLRKFARRNKAVLAITAGFAAVLVAGAAVSVWQAIRATGAERQAKAETARAEGEAKNARTEAAISRAISDFLNRDLLASANPNVLYTRDSEPQRELKLRTVLDRAAGRIEGRFRDQPLVEAALRHTIGQTYMRLAEDRLAEPHIRRAADLRREHLGPEHRDTLDSMFVLSWVRGDEGEMRRVLETRRRVLGADDPGTLFVMYRLTGLVRKRGDYPAAIALIRETLERFRRLYGEDSVNTAYIKHYLAHTLVVAGDAAGAGRADDAEIDRLSRQALAVYRGRNNFGTWHAWDIIVRRGEFLRSRGRFEEAEEVYREGYEGLQALPATPPEWSAVLAAGLVETYRGWGKPALATEWARKQKAAERAALVLKTGLLMERPDDTDLLLSQAALFAVLGRLDDAVLLYRKAILIKPDSFEAHHQLSDALIKQDKWEQAETECRAALRIKPDGADLEHKLGHILGRLGKFTEAEAAFREAIRLAPAAAGYHHNFADLLRRQEKFAEAEAEYREARRIDPNFADLPHLAEMLCYQMGDYERGVAVLKELIKRRPDFAPAYALLGAAEARQARWAEAAAAYRRATELAPDDDNRYFGANLELAAGNTDNYRRVCRQMLERFADTDQPMIAERTAKACLLLPDALNPVDFDRAQKLAERAVTGTETNGDYRFFTLAKGLAEYRAGRHAGAVKWLARFAPNEGGTHVDATAFAVLGMAQYRLGRAEEAEAALAKAKTIMAKMPDPARGQPFGGDWNDWVHAQFLCREAEKLLAE